MGVISVQNLTKIYSQALKEPGLKGSIKHLFKPNYVEKKAVNNIEFEIQEGESVAYLGKNGAGKSTTIKMLTGVLRPTSGSVLVNNINPFSNRVEYCRNIGVVFGQRTQLWWDIPVRESLELLKDMYSVSDYDYKVNLDEFCDLLGLNEFLHLTTRNLSLGQRMRADIAAALLHNPKILFMDEPTLGLDVSAKDNIRDFIKRINEQRRTTVLLTTHDLGDIEQICKRLILIDKGKILYDGSLGNVIKTFEKSKKIHFTFEEPSPTIRSVINSLEGVTIEQVIEQFNEEIWTVDFDYSVVSPGEIISNVLKVAKLKDIKIEEPNIENVLKRVYTGEISFIKKGELTG